MKVSKELLNNNSDTIVEFGTNVCIFMIVIISFILNLRVHLIYFLLDFDRFNECTIYLFFHAKNSFSAAPIVEGVTQVIAVISEKVFSSQVAVSAQ